MLLFAHEENVQEERMTISGIPFSLLAEAGNGLGKFAAKTVGRDPNLDMLLPEQIVGRVQGKDLPGTDRLPYLVTPCKQGTEGSVGSRSTSDQRGSPPSGKQRRPYEQIYCI
jgi:hypothetical protein